MKPDGTAAHADSIQFFPLLPDSSARSGFPSGIRGKIRTVLPKVGFHPESEAKSGQFCPKWVSIRNSGQNPDSSAQSGFPSGIRGKIRTVSKVFHFHPFC